MRPRSRSAMALLAILGVVGCMDAQTPGNLKPPAAMPIRLSTGVALPQTGPNGTLMLFSVDYEFVEGEPSAEGYVWVIERAQGKPVRKEVKLLRKGNLPTPMPGWLPDDGPFHTHIEDHKSARISASIELR